MGKASTKRIPSLKVKGLKGDTQQVFMKRTFIFLGKEQKTEGGTFSKKKRKTKQGFFPLQKRRRASEKR